MGLRSSARLVVLGALGAVVLASGLPQVAVARARQPAPSPSPIPLMTATPSAVEVTSTPGPLPAPSYVPISPNGVPTLPPADQESPLPFPAYGTPAPASPPHVESGIPQIITLQQAILIAYARSPLLAEARAQVAIETAPVALAQSAIFPSLSATGTSSRDHSQAGTSSGGESGTGTGASSDHVFPPWYTQNGLSFQLQQLIYDGGRVADQIRAARATQSATIATYQRELQTIAYNVANTYYNVLTAQRQLQVDVATVALDQVQENLVAAQIQAGTEAAADLSTAQLPTEQARVAVIKQQATELIALATFANTLGIDAAVNAQPKDDVPALSATSGTIVLTPAFPTPSYDQAYARANALRPDLTSAQQNVLSFQWNLRAAKLGLWPNLTANGAYNIQSSDPGGGSFRNSGSIGVSLAIPIYDRGVTRAETAQAQGQLDNAVAQLVVEQESIQLGVQTALVNLVSSYAALSQTNAELAKAQDVLRSTEAQYRAGVTTLPLLLNAQVGLTEALTDEVSAVYAVRQSEQALLYAEGTNAAG